MKIKICGVTRAEDARLACSLGAWAVGLVFAPKSPRRVSLAQAGRIRGGIERALAVGVFQDASRSEILRVVEECALDAVQLHGVQSPADCAGFSVPVIKAFGLSPGEIPALAGYEIFAALLEPARGDAERAAGKKLGAKALSHAWAAAAALRGKGPMIILAGGLTPENVGAAVQAAGPDAVDVSGGVESSFGIKDPKKLQAFFQALS